MPCNGQCFTVIQIHNLEVIIVMKYIESLREGERINEIYLCKTKTVCADEGRQTLRKRYFTG